MVDLLGYSAMLLVLISVSMSNIKAFRILNSIACGMFVVYGFILSTTPTYPIIIMNIAVILINIYHLTKKK
jgi:hypothetical protein